MPGAVTLKTNSALNVYLMRSSSDTLSILMECVEDAMVTEAHLIEDGGVTSLCAGGVEWDVNFTVREGVLRSFTVINTATGAFARVSNAYQSPEYESLCRILTGQS